MTDRTHPSPRGNDGGVGTLTPPPRWSPELAERALPLVRRIAEDILEASRTLGAQRVLASDPDDADVRALEDEIAVLVAELESLGCRWSDWTADSGLVDFPARIDGEDVTLCWKTDEAHVAWFRPVDGAFTERRPVPVHLRGGAKSD